MFPSEQCKQGDTGFARAVIINGFAGNNGGSFKVPQSSGKTREDILRELTPVASGWMKIKSIEID